MVLRQGLALALWGVALGVAGAFWLTRLMTGLLHGVQPTDSATFVTVPVALVLVARGGERRTRLARPVRGPAHRAQV